MRSVSSSASMPKNVTSYCPLSISLFPFPDDESLWLCSCDDSSSRRALKVRRYLKLLATSFVPKYCPDFCGRVYILTYSFTSMWNLHIACDVLLRRRATMQSDAHVEAMHPYAPFPIGRLNLAVMSVPEHRFSTPHEKEMPLLSLLVPRGAARVEPRLLAAAARQQVGEAQAKTRNVNSMLAHFPLPLKCIIEMWIEHNDVALLFSYFLVYVSLCAPCPSCKRVFFTVNWCDKGLCVLFVNHLYRRRIGSFGSMLEYCWLEKLIRFWVWLQFP
jgi:hypothetical protein